MLIKAKQSDKTTVIYVETIRDRKLSGYAYAWWEVPVPEISNSKEVRKAREDYDKNKKNQKSYIKPQQ